MAVTLSGTQVTFNDGSVQSTKATILGARQVGPNHATTFGGTTGYPTSSVTTAQYWLNLRDAGSSGDSNSTVFCGFDIYRYGTSNTSRGDDSGLDGPLDASLVYVRPVYRSIS